MKNRSRVFGVGLNDLPYAVTEYKIVEGKSVQVWMCPYYSCWKHMLNRCVNTKNKKFCNKNNLVVDSWLYASKFKAWMETQDWEGKYLDKDILVKDNRIYGPNTCAFIPNYLNSLLNGREASRGEFPLGVNKRFNKYHAQISIDSKRISLGYFDDHYEAHLAWKLAKIQAIKFAIIRYKLEDGSEAVIQSLVGRINFIQNSIDNREEIIYL